MNSFPGWMTGALGVGALVGAFYMGGRVGTTGAPFVAQPASEIGGAPTTPAATATPELAVTCEPGQRAVVYTAAGDTSRVACVSEAAPLSARRPTGEVRYVPDGPADVVRVADRDDRPYARPAVITEPVEVYRPRARQAGHETPGAAAPKRSVTKSVVIIAGSTAAGAAMGGLVKGKRGAVIGGLVGGGAATVWDQVTRRKADVR